MPLCYNNISTGDFAEGRYITMENTAETPSEELEADIVCFAELFERLSPDAKAAILEILRQLNETK